MDVEASYYLGLTYYELEKYEYAVDAFDSALLIDPGHYRSIYQLGMTYEKMGYLENAIKQY